MEHVPVPDRDSEVYWRNVAEGRLVLQRCAACEQWIFYPRSICPHCWSEDLGWFPAAGTGTIHTFTVVHRAFNEFASSTPFACALVDLDEGVRMMTRIVGIPLEQVEIGLRVQVTFTQLVGDVTLPCFTVA